MTPGSRADHWTRVAGGLIVSVSLCFAAYCYLSHLSGALGYASDENRAYHYQLLSPLLYFFSRPFTHHFQSLDAPYYLLGVLGLMNIVLTGWLIRRTVSPAAGWIATVLLCFYDYPLVYAKILYYSTIHLFFMLTSMICFGLALKQRATALFFLSGVLAGMIILVNPSGVIICVVILIYITSCLLSTPTGGSIRNFTGILLTMAMGALAAYAVFEIFIMFWLKSHPSLDQMSFFTSCRIYGSETPGVYTLGYSFVKNALTGFWVKTLTLEEGGWYRLLYLTVFAGVGSAWALFKSERKVRPLVLCGLIGAAVQILLAFFGIQPFLERTFLWLVVPIIGLSAYALERLWKNGSPLRRILSVLLTIIFFIFGTQKCIAITEATFSVNPINQYLEKKVINREQVATLLPIDRYKDFVSGHRTKPIVTLTSSNPNSPLRRRPIIHWAAVNRMYRAGAIRYLLTSGISSPTPNIGNDDPLLMRVVPMMEWDHPSANRHIYGPVPAVSKIKLYDLEKVLGSKEALAYILQIERRINQAGKRR